MKSKKNRKPLDKEKSFSRRTLAVAVVLGVVLLIFVARLVQFQLF